MITIGIGMKVAICGLNNNDLDKQFQKNNLTIKISSSLNVEYIFDKKKLLCYLCVFKFKYLPLHHTCLNPFF